MKELTDDWIDILMILSDDGGHPSWEIAEKLGKKPGNLSKVITKLENEPLEGDWDFVIDPKDIRDPKSLISKIFDGKDEISEYINGKIDRERGVPSSGEQLSIYCAKLLNEFLINANIYEDKSFCEARDELLGYIGIGLSLRGYPHGYVLDLPRLNRVFLLYAIKDELCSSENPIIFRERRPTSRPKPKKEPKSNYNELSCCINENLHIFDFILMNLANILKNDLSPHYGPELIAEEPNRLYIKTKYVSYESKNLDRINNFLSSQYTIKLIQKFGLKLIFDITKNRTKEFVPSIEWEKNAAIQ